MVASDGSAKRVEASQFPKQGRYGQGVVAWKLPPKVKAVGMAVGKGTTRLTLFLGKLAPKMIRLDEAPLQGRAARGRVIQVLKAGDQVTGLSVASERPGSTSPTQSTKSNSRPPAVRKPRAATTKSKTPTAASKPAPAAKKTPEKTTPKPRPRTPK